MPNDSSLPYRASARAGALVRGLSALVMSLGGALGVVACEARLIGGDPPRPARQSVPPDCADSSPGVEAERAASREAISILSDRCVRCHGGVRELGGLSLITRAGAAHVLGTPGGATSSVLYQRITAVGPTLQMPPQAEALSEHEVLVLRQWLDAGAPWPAHWAYAPLTIDCAPPAAERLAPRRLDEIVLSRLDERGLSFAEVASPVERLTRVSLDLSGLPPSRADVEAFELDPSERAFSAFVDRLLDGTAYAERSARLWLDLARYSDSDGYEQDQPRYGAYRYRDWVIEAFLGDMPFDEFSRAQIAGDLLADADDRDRVATAFNTQTLLNREGGVDPEEDRVKRVVDRVVTLGRTWLGLTLECAQCHDHPYDPIGQREFYGLFAFFDRAPEVSLDGDEGEPPVDVLTAATQPKPTYVLTRGDFLHPDVQAGPIEPKTPSMLPPLEARGEHADRLDLANWLVDPGNTLVLRVRVNAIWAQLFGRGLVEPRGDFGVRGSVPDNLELLDSLVETFRMSGFSNKELLREIVLSRTYSQSSEPSAVARDIDPDNRLLSHQNRFRLDAETTRDRILFVSGLLTDRPFGPSVFPPLPSGMEELIVGPVANFVWDTGSDGGQYRRSLYTFHKRIAPYPPLKVFDWPAADASLAERPRSNSPLQALTLLHEPTYVAAAAKLAQEAASSPEPIAELFRRILGREASREELAACAALSAGGAPGSPPAILTDAPSLGSLTLVARSLMNLDEFVMRP